MTGFGDSRETRVIGLSKLGHTTLYKPTPEIRGVQGLQTVISVRDFLDPRTLPSARTDITKNVSDKEDKK